MVYVKSGAKRSVHLYKAGFSDIVLQSSMERTEGMNGGETCWHDIPFIPRRAPANPQCVFGLNVTWWSLNFMTCAAYLKKKLHDIWCPET